MQECLGRFAQLKRYCEKEGFRGWDPYDGLTSRLFQSMALARRSPLVREALIQFCKRSPVNFRGLLAVPKMYNAKGVALFLSGYCNLFRAVKRDGSLSRYFGELPSLRERIVELSDLLLSLQSKGDYHGACWGYGFDWQSKAFFLPAHTPTVVATSFAVEALLSAFEITGVDGYRAAALSSANFVLDDLNRIPKELGFMFSYSPLDQRAVYNASLLGAKTLAMLYGHTGNGHYKEVAAAVVRAVCDAQNPDGSFPHSDQVGNVWRDNFHTGFKLESIALYQRLCGDGAFADHLERGYRYWIENYFDPATGMAKCYDRGQKPGYIDLHCFAQSLPTLFKLQKLEEQEALARKEVEWAFANMWSVSGYFYFQRKHGLRTKIPYMRWPNAWCFYGLSYWFLFEAQR